MKKPLRTALLAAVLVSVCVMLVAFWARRQGSFGKIGTTATESAIPSGPFNIGLAGLGEVATLDPPRAWTAAPLIIVWQIYDRLVDIDPEGRLRPMVASEWAASSDQREWRFRIRPDVRFHPDASGNSRAVTPADVKASIERALRIPGYGQTLMTDILQGAQELAGGKSASASGISISGNEVVFRLTHSFAFFPQRVAASFYGIVPEGSGVEGSEPPLGTGPYRLVSWDRTSNRVGLERVARHWAPVSDSSPKEITFHVLGAEGAAVEELRSGSLDWLEATSSAIPLFGATPERGIVVSTPPQNSVRLIAANMAVRPFSEYPDLGVALNKATDRQEIVRLLGGGAAVEGPVPSETGEGETLPFDLGGARRIVSSLPKQARRLELLVQPGAESRLLAEVLGRQWQKAGLDVALQPGLADFFDRVAGGKYQLALGYYGPFIASPEQYLWLYRRQAQPIPNVMRFSSDNFEAAFAEYVAAAEPRGQSAALGRAIRALIERPAVVWLARAPAVVGVRGAWEASRTSSIPVFSTLHHSDGK